jgi:Tfp pilus assembly protein PilO
MSTQAFLALLRRYPHAAVCSVLTIALLATAFYLHGQIADLQTTQQARAKEGEAMLDLMVGGTAQRQELALVHEIARRIEDNLVVETNLAENLWYFAKFEEQTKARLPELHQLNSPPGDASPLFKRVPYTLRVTGNFEQVAAFLLALETGPRLVNVTSFNWVRTGTASMTLDLAVELLAKK